MANSTSTMHKIHAKPFTLSDFSHNHLTEEGLESLNRTVEDLERIRLRFIEGKKKEDWYTIIQLLPSSYEQMRTCTMNYESLINMYFSRKAISWRSGIFSVIGLKACLCERINFG